MLGVTFTASLLPSGVTRLLGIQLNASHSATTTTNRLSQIGACLANITKLTLLLKVIIIHNRSLRLPSYDTERYSTFASSSPDRARRLNSTSGTAKYVLRTTTANMALTNNIAAIIKLIMLLDYTANAIGRIFIIYQYPFNNYFKTSHLTDPFRLSFQPHLSLGQAPAGIF